MKAPKYKRILLKLSGEALAAGADGILNFDFIDRIAEVLVRCRAAGVEIGVIVGAGNIWRGRQGGEMDRTQADHMGMLATAINALALQDRFCAAGLDAVVMSAVDISGRSHLEYSAEVKAKRVGNFDTELVEEFFLGFVRNAGVTLHIKQLDGKNSHHIIEGTFKSVARAIRAAVKIDPDFADEIPSTKGAL